MIKKLLISIFLINFSTAYAGSVYLSPMLYYQSVTSNGSAATNAHYQSWNPTFSIGYGNMFNEWLYGAGEIAVAPGSITIHNN